LVVSATAWAQTAGTVNGTVKDETGGVLPGVTVNLHPLQGAEVMTFTDETGSYRFEDVPSGTASLTFQLINFTHVRREITVPAAAELTVDAVLALSLTAEIVVTAPRTFRNIADLERPAENLVGIAAAASQGAITARQLEGRPIMRPAEVLEAVPGLIASQHSGEGKANQYYLRGFNLDHGSDFAITVAGTPVNMPSGAHFHGYADTNLLIPELVSGVQFSKGPYFAEDGDFSAAGSTVVNYANSLERPLASVTAGGQGYRRLFTAASPRLGRGHVLVGVELASNDGPWDRPDNLQKVNGIVRYSRGDSRTGFSVTAMGYSADWDSTDQVPRRAIDSGRITRFGNVDPTDGGRTSRYTLVADGQTSTGNASTRATGYVVRYDLNLFNNFTYFLEDPVNGDQFEQAERRWVTGGRLAHKRLGHIFGRHMETGVGAQIRDDNVGHVGLFPTIARRRLGVVRDDGVRQTSVAGFARSEIEWTRVVRTTVGLRGDVYRFSVASSAPANSGDGTAGIISPKFTAVLGPWQSTEFYVNVGTGFHSNDARGATITVDPRTGEPVDRVNLLTRARGAELGLRTVRIEGLQSTVALWYLGFDSELLFIGDAGITEASRPSRRLGVEWANYARLNRIMTAEVDVAFSRARFTDDDPTGDFIPGALDRVVSAALTVEPHRSVFGSIRLRHFGPRPLIEDASVVSHSTTIWNGELGVQLTSQARILVEGFNLFNSSVADIDYFYTSRLLDEPLGGVDDVHTHPSIPRTARVALEVRF
jgi:hypothetical protein